MGMYDTINGEQVKCFPWVSFYKNEISYHGGDLEYYGVGDEVPYKRPHYNYGKNFIILDLNRYPGSDFCPYDYILHVVVDGKVKETFENEIGYINWSINENVVTYTGELLNIKSSEDMVNYMAAQREFWKEYERIRKNWNDLFSEMSQYMHGIGLLDKDSVEKKERLKKIENIHKLMDKERENIQPQIESLKNKFSKWFVDTSNINDLIDIGDLISAYETESAAKREYASTCKELIQKLLDADSTLYDRYVKWQGSDQFIRQFKENKNESNC